mgnify:CR=1 FL=1
MKVSMVPLPRSIPELCYRINKRFKNKIHIRFPRCRYLVEGDILPDPEGLPDQGRVKTAREVTLVCRNRKRDVASCNHVAQKAGAGELVRVCCIDDEECRRRMAAYTEVWLL